MLRRRLKGHQFKKRTTRTNEKGAGTESLRKGRGKRKTGEPTAARKSVHKLLEVKTRKGESGTDSDETFKERFLTREVRRLREKSHKKAEEAARCEGVFFTPKPYEGEKKERKRRMVKLLDRKTDLAPTPIPGCSKTGKRAELDLGPGGRDQDPQDHGFQRGGSLTATMRGS